MAARIRILIADDHPIVRQGIAAVIDREPDLEVVGEAGDGAEAVEQAKALSPDVILMDLQMPKMDGAEAIKRLGDEAPEIKVIILTTYDTDDYIFRGLESGARGYLLKDAPPEEVVRAVRVAYRGESLIEPRIASRLLDRIDRLGGASAGDAGLSEREVEVLSLLANGSTNKQIAAELYIGESTVKTHVLHIFGKLDVSDRTAAVMEAARKGIIQI